MRVGPDFDVFIDALKRRATELEVWVDAAQRCRELEIQRAVILRLHVLAVSFFTYLDVGDGVLVIFEIANLGRGIVRRFIEQRDGHHGGQTARDSALEEEIEADLRFLRVYRAVGSVPGIDG